MGADAPAARSPGSHPAPADIDPATIASPLRAIPAGVFRPLFAGKDQADSVPVAPFLLEEHPVTNGQFAAFVRANPEWRRDRVPALFAQDGYLADWSDPTGPAPDQRQAPVTRVSWFAARAYARWIGRRLPTAAEWERAAQAPLPGDGSEADRVRRILAWYGEPTPQRLPSAMAGPADVHGVRALHGLVWEWVEDFNTALVSGESRGDSGLERNLFCGAGSVGAADPSDYAAFMRFAFRSSLEAGFTVRNLGFRCATSRPTTDHENEPEIPR